MTDVLVRSDEEIAAAIAAGFCRICLGAGEITEILGQDRVTGLIHDRTWTCHECAGAGQAPVYDDGLTDAQYDALRRAELGLTVCALRSCQRETSNPSGYCDDCWRDAMADHDSQREAS